MYRTNRQKDVGLWGAGAVWRNYVSTHNEPMSISKNGMTLIF